MAAVLTIAAIATAPSAGGVGIVRLSGPAALAIARPFAPQVPERPSPRHAYFTDVLDQDGQVLDQGLFLFFQAPHSFTGDEVVELQTHGSPRLLELLQALVLRDARVRLAEPGEFTRRAFLNGRLDLARAEAVADLIAAESEAAVRTAAAQVRGVLSDRVRAIREPLLALRAELEALLDFPDEAEGAGADTQGRLAAALTAARALLEHSGQGRLMRRGARVVLYGPVNAGKSTLFNRLVGEARALVDDEPGTTRDALEARVELAGLAVSLVDTAGLREDRGAGRVEAMGIARTRAALGSADLALLLVPPEASPDQVAAWAVDAGDTPLVRVEGKGDLRTLGARRLDGLERAVDSRSLGATTLCVSGLTGAGVDALRSAIVSRLVADRTPESVALTSERHADRLRGAVESLERAQAALTASTLEVVSGEVGLAVEALGEITGENASDELLNAIFRRFCIGK